MKQSRLYVVRTLTGVACLLLLLLLAACGGGGSDASATPTPAPTPTPNPAVAQTYTGNGYTIGYPKNWNKGTLGQATLFTDPATGTTIVIGGGPDDGSSLDKVLDGFTTDIQQTTQDFAFGEDPDAVVTLAGENWSQRTYSGMQGEDPYKGVEMATKHKGNIFAIRFTALVKNYDDGFYNYFQPIMQSFKFTS